jgi:hypothetical protein
LATALGRLSLDPGLIAEIASNTSIAASLVSTHTGRLPAGGPHHGSQQGPARRYSQQHVSADPPRCRQSGDRSRSGR